MPIAYRDFWPANMAHGKHAHWEPLALVVERANHWLVATGFRALNVETVVLPVPRQAAPNSAAGSISARWDEDHTWAQVVRVWHEVPPVGGPAMPTSAATATLPTVEAEVSRYAPRDNPLAS